MILYGHDAEIAEWVGSELECYFEPAAKAIGLVLKGRIIAGVVYHTYRPGYNIEMSIASITPRWANENSLRAFFTYPFIQLNLPRVTAVTSNKATSVQKFLERLGFIKEGMMREAHPDGDALIYGLLRKDCKYIEELPDGQKKLTITTAAA